MLLPISSDVPLYHRPVGTVLLIIANCVTFIITDCGYSHEGWILTFGNGIHPIEWISSAFLHFGFMHIVGNMIFLWAYGMIIEGKIGTVRFLSLYFLICALDGAIVQMVMLIFSDPPVPGEPIGGAGGASGAIFAMIAIALLWAPRNTFTVIWMVPIMGIFGRGGMMELSVFFLSMFYLVMNLIEGLLMSFTMSTPVLHLFGAIVGFPIGIHMLNQKWVDCEGWDVFTLREKDAKLAKKMKRKEQKRKFQSSETVVRDAIETGTPKKMLKSIRRSIEQKQFRIAGSKYLDYRSNWPKDPKLPELELRALIEGLRQCESWHEVVIVLEDYLALEPDDKPRAQLMQASILVVNLNRPQAAEKAVHGIDESHLNEKEQLFLKRLRATVAAQLEDGVIELSLD